MAIKKFNGLESQLASSILYYDKEELYKFFNVYDKISLDPNILIDGIFDTFVRHLRKLEDNNFNEDPQQRKNNIVSYIILMNEQNPDKNSRDTFSLWFENVTKIQSPMELAEEILDHFLWEAFKKSIDLADKSKMPFSEKLNIKPYSLNDSTNDEIVNLGEIELKEEVDSIRYTTGYEPLDRYVRLVPTNFVVIAARPGVGKSLLMLQGAMSNARNGIKTLFLSLEMNQNQIDKRITFSYIGENLEDRYENDLGVLDFKAYKDAYNHVKSSRGYKPLMQNLQLYVTKMSSADAILDKLEKQIQENGYQAVFIDYLQLLKYGRMDEWASLRALTNALKNMAFRLNILIVTGSQVARSSTEHGLYLTDLYGSSTIEADADVIIGLESLRERRQGEIAIINVKALKNREGDLCSIKSGVDYSIGKIMEKE